MFLKTYGQLYLAWREEERRALWAGTGVYGEDEARKEGEGRALWGRNKTWGKRQRCLYPKDWTRYSKNTTKKLDGWMV